MDINEIENRQMQLENEGVLPQKVEKTIKCKENVHIVYLMVWTKVCGGSKIILEYANKLSLLGDRVTIVTYDEKPDWFALNDSVNFVKVEDNEELYRKIPECDVIVPTSWKCIYDAIKSQKALVTFFEQGGAHLFEKENLTEEKRKVVQARFDLVQFVHTVSSYSKDMIKKEYNKETEVICNAVDSRIFFADNVEREKNGIEITIIGSEEFKFKNISNILKAYRILKKEYNNLNLNWITQSKPVQNHEPAIINPKQIEIGNILRKTDIYVCNSEYESFGLPTLEAMTCGAAVITTDTGGMRDFAFNNKNALITRKNDIDDLVEKMKILIDNPELRKKLANEGKKSAKVFNWENSVKKMHEYYLEISKYRVIGQEEGDV